MDDPKKEIDRANERAKEITLELWKALAPLREDCELDIHKYPAQIKQDGLRVFGAFLLAAEDEPSDGSKIPTVALAFVCRPHLVHLSQILVSSEQQPVLQKFLELAEAGAENNSIDFAQLLKEALGGED